MSVPPAAAPPSLSFYPFRSCYHMAGRGANRGASSSGGSDDRAERTDGNARRPLGVSHHDRFPLDDGGPDRPGLVDRSLWAARVVTLASFLDLFMQFPVVAPYAATLGASAGMGGAIVGMYSAANLAGNVLSGAVLDRWGRRGPLLGGLAATAAAVMLYVLARSPGQLLGVRAFQGFAAAILTVGAFTIMGDAARADHRARVMGRSGAVIGAAAVLGPPLAGAPPDRGRCAAPVATVALLMPRAPAALSV